jgi:hypothetical protein
MICMQRLRQSVDDEQNRALSARQLLANCSRYLGGNIGLRPQKIISSVIVRFGPNVSLIAGLHHLHRDSEMAPLQLGAAIQDILHPSFAPADGRGFLAGLVWVNRGLRTDNNLGRIQFAQMRDQYLRHSLGDEAVGWSSAEIAKRKNYQRHRGRRRHGAGTCWPIVDSSEKPSD